MNIIEGKPEEQEKPKVYIFNNNKLSCRITFVANLDLIPYFEKTNSSALITIKAKWLFILFSFQRAKIKSVKK